MGADPRGSGLSPAGPPRPHFRHQSQARVGTCAPDHPALRGSSGAATESGGHCAMCTSSVKGTQTETGSVRRAPGRRGPLPVESGTPPSWHVAASPSRCDQRGFVTNVKGHTCDSGSWRIIVAPCQEQGQGPNTFIWPPAPWSTPLRAFRARGAGPATAPGPERPHSLHRPSAPPLPGRLLRPLC